MSGSTPHNGYQETWLKIQSYEPCLCYVVDDTAGVYAAKLLRSMGRSSVVIEIKPHFGGHTKT